MNNETPAEKKTTTAEELQETTELGTGVKIIFMTLLIEGILCAYMGYSTAMGDYYSTVPRFAAWCLMGVAPLVLAIYAIAGFVFRKPSAVFLALVCAIVTAIPCVLIALLRLKTSPDLAHILPQALCVIVNAGIAFYLSTSEAVEDVLPKGYRKVSNTEINVVSFIITLPMILYGIAVIDSTFTSNERRDREQEVMSGKRGPREMSDGRMTFTIPPEYDCKAKVIKRDGSDYKMFYMERGEGDGAIFSSDYYNLRPKSDTNIRFIIELWAKNWITGYLPDGADFDYEWITVGGRDCVFFGAWKRVRGGYRHWRHYILFDDATGKMYVGAFLSQRRKFDSTIYQPDEMPGEVRYLFSHLRFE